MRRTAAVVKKLFNILTGWGKRLGILQVSKAEDKLADLRLAVCKACPLSKENKVLKILNGNAGYEGQLLCTKCHCPCYEKAIVIDEKCPIYKW